MNESTDVPRRSPELARGRIFAFYSHTGGTGRSLTLATVAWILASAGHRVLAVDWSLGAPSLHRFVAPFLRDRELRSTPGVVEMITELMTDGLASPHPEAAADATWVRRHALVLNHCVSLDYDYPAQGALDLLPAGRQSPGYNARVAAIDWNHFYQRHRGGAFLGLLRESMLEHYQYVLIDTMNGGAPPAALVTGLLADTVVVCARAGTGSIEGAAAAARSILAQPGIRRRQVLPALLQVDRTDSERADVTLRFAEKQQWSDVLPGTSPLRIAEIPYSTELAFEEIIASFAGTSTSAIRVLRACEGLAASLTDGAVVGNAELEQAAPRYLVDLYRRMVPTAVPTELEGETSHVVISYVAYDRLWAEWLKEQLERAGIGSRLVGNANPDLELGDLPPGTRMLALLSQRYLESRHARAVWQSVLGQEAAAGRRIIVPLRLDYATPEGQFARYAYLDLAAKDALTARNAVLTALGRELPEDDEAALDKLSTSYPRGNITWTATNLDQRNENFFGRSDILEELRDALDLTATEDPIEDARVLPVVVLHAADGIGKGEVAHEYAYRFAPEYDVVWRLPGEPDADLRGALAALAKELGVNPPGHDDQSLVRETVASVADRRVLFIFEYADDPRPIIELLPTHARATQVIICAQLPAGEQAATDIKIGLFHRDESLQFLGSRGVELPDGSARDIANRVHDLPMALEQAAVALAGGMTADQYTRAFDGWIREVANADPEDHQRALFAAWLVTFEWLRGIDAPTADLLELCACFGPGAIPEELLRGVNVMESLGLQSHERDRLEGMLDRLHEFSLARIQPGSRSVELHRLLRRTVQAQLTEERLDRNQAVIAEALAKADPGDTEDAKNWPTYERLLPHVQACTLWSDQEPVQHLLADSVRAAWRSGSWTAGMKLADAALDAWDELYGDDDTFVLLMRYHRVNILWSQGDFTGVREQATDIRERFERIMGEDNEYTLITATILAASERALGHFKRARELDRDTLERLQASAPVRNRRRLNAAHNLADSERLMGQYALARQLDEETLQRRITWLGYEHSWTLQSLASLGYDLRALGELQSSAENLTIALAGLERVVGNRHEDTIRTRKSLAAARRRLDQLDEAAILINQAADEADAIFPADHPDLLAILLERAAVLAANERYDDARALARDVMERFGRMPGDDNDDPHPFRLAAEVNYLAYLRRIRRTTRAGLSTARRVYTDLAGVLEPRHPWAVLARVNIGNYLFDRAQFSEAHAVDEETYRLAQEVLGPKHPDTVAAGINLVVSSARNHHNSVTASLSGSLTETAEELFGFHHRIARAARERERCDCDLELPPI